jgi:hypothetical protein
MTIDLQLLAEGGDGYDDAIKELTKKAKSQDKQKAITDLAIKSLMKKGGKPFENLAIKSLMRKAEAQKKQVDLTRIKRDQLSIEQIGAKRTLRSLKKAQSTLIDQLKLDLQLMSKQELRQLASNKGLITDYLMKNGFGEAVGDWVTTQDEMVKGVLDAIKTIDPEAVLQQGIPEIEALQLSSTELMFDDLIITEAQRDIKTALNNLIITDEPSAVISNLVQQMNKATGFQLTTIKTKISEFGRSATAIAGKQAGLNHYLYTGPMDGLTRGFCFHLINKVISEEQMSKLRNNQIEPVLTNAGGYNCRHSLSPVSKGYIEAAGLELATNQDIQAANQAAKKRG